MTQLRNDCATRKRSKKARHRLTPRQLSVTILILALLRALVELAAAILSLLE